VVDTVTGRHRAVVIRFPAWLKGTGPVEESYPLQLIAWLPGGKLLLGTSGLGIGLQLTGIWVASPAGGAARLIVGTPNSPRLVLKFPLLNATQALLSPDGTKLLLDPGNRFWIASSSGGNGRVLNRSSRSCLMSQAAWVGNAHVAYVCIGGGPANVFAHLYAVTVAGGHPRLLASIHSRQQDALSIAPPTRCIACGGA
jgi:hypothetical protein